MKTIIRNYLSMYILLINRTKKLREDHDLKVKILNVSQTIC